MSLPFLPNVGGLPHCLKKWIFGKRRCHCDLRLLHFGLLLVAGDLANPELNPPTGFPVTKKHTLNCNVGKIRVVDQFEFSLSKDASRTSDDA